MSNVFNKAFNVTFNDFFQKRFDSAVEVLLPRLAETWCGEAAAIDIVRLEVEAEQAATGHDLSESLLDVVTRLAFFS